MKYALQLILGVTLGTPSLGFRFGSGLGLNQLGVLDGGPGGGGLDHHAGIDHFLNSGSTVHFDPYTRGPQGRQFGVQIGGELGAFGAGASAGVGNGQFGFSSIFGFDKKMKKPEYRPYYYTPYRGPWFRPRRESSL